MVFFCRKKDMLSPLAITAGASALSGLVGGIFGGSKSARENRRMRRYLDRAEDENKMIYNRDYYSNILDRSDTRNLINQMQNTLRKENNRADNIAAITGATAEQTAAQKNRATRAVSDTYSRIGAMGQQWKDGVLNNYLQGKNNIQQQRMGMAQSAAEQGANLQGNAFPSILNSLPTLASSFTKTPKTETP